MKNSVRKSQHDIGVCTWLITKNLRLKIGRIVWWEWDAGVGIPLKVKTSINLFIMPRFAFSLLASTLSCFRFQVLLQYSPIVDILLLSRVNDLGYSLNIR